MADGQIGLFDAIYSQRAVRSLRPDPVPEEHLTRIIEAATKAPSGGNSQPWAFVGINEREMIGKLAVFVQDAFAPMYDSALANANPNDPPPYGRLKWLVDAFDQVPAVILACYVGREGVERHPREGLSSVYPAVQNLLLAARGLGLGATLTGLAINHANGKYKGDVKALLGIPEHVEPLVLIPIGYPDKERYGSTTRKPVAEVTHWNSWGDQRE